ncbi:hypothetical protein FQZ97_770150 [compost metagenome]
MGQGRVVVNVDGQAANRGVAVGIGHLVADGEAQVVLVFTGRVHDRPVLDHAVGPRRPVQGQGDDGETALLDQQVVAALLIDEARGCAGIQQADGARAIGAEAVAEGPAEVGGVGVDIARTVGVTTGQGIVIQLDSFVDADLGRVVAEADGRAQADRGRGAVAIAVGERQGQLDQVGGGQAGGLVRATVRHMQYRPQLLQGDLAVLAHRDPENDSAIGSSDAADNVVAKGVKQDVATGFGVVQPAVRPGTADAQAV